MTEEVLTRRQAAQLIGVSERTIARNEGKWGLTPTYPTSRLALYHRSDVEAYLARKRQAREGTSVQEVLKRSYTYLLTSPGVDEEKRWLLRHIALLLGEQQERQRGDSESDG